MAMNDRGEKIINLAREMLRTDIEPSETRTPISFKVLCLATMLTAFGSSAVTTWLNDARRPINRYEKTELKALIFYAARVKGIDEESLRQDVIQRFDIASLDDLTHRDFRDARNYLQDKIH